MWRSDYQQSLEMREMHEYRTFAIDLAERAGKIQMDCYAKMHAVEWNTRHHFRTEVDIVVGKLVREAIEQRFPDHNIFSEEEREKVTGNKLSWVVDELDGTIPYTRGTTDHFSFSIALCMERRPVLGVIYAPKRKELYVASEGSGASCNGSPIRVSGLMDIHKAFVGVESGKTKRTSHLSFIEKLLGEDGVTCDTRTACATVPLCFVASGKLDAFLATQLQPEDMAAAVIIVREAGGKVTTLPGIENDERGEEWQLGNKTILAANPTLHERLRVFLEKK
ncbi:MAG: inositol monophosphatase [bacterium]|nr:inositol monophosphatase [bacterium]